MADNEFKTIQPPQSSEIKRRNLNGFLSTLFGFRKAKDGKNVNFVQVDLDSNQRINQAFIANAPSTSGKLNKKLDELWNSWLNETDLSTGTFMSRLDRCNQLLYAFRNDPFIYQTVNLYADEATQLDIQDTIINIETPDVRMTRDMYSLLNQWGITQTRVRSTIKEMALYGDAFWANKISEKGVERIIPMKQMDVTERLEFDPLRALEMKKRREGQFGHFASKNYLIGEMLDSMDDSQDIAEIFDRKLFGFALERDLVVPAWSVSHFRVDADMSQFYPFGESPILGALPTFKQMQSTITLQSIARVMSFPVTVYEVNTNDSMDEARQFAMVDRVREAYDNIGVLPNQGGSESFTVNTKIWAPKGLLSIETKGSNVDTKNIDDLKLYQERNAVACGLPKSFFSDDWYGLNGSASGKSLMQQYKPWARKVYSVQSAFLETLADLFRIHFAITGVYDFRTPFTLSMKFPAEEETKDKIESQKDSMSLASEVVKLIKSMIGAEEDETLPPDIIRDIVGKYTFLDASDIMKWSRDASYAPRKGVAMDLEGGNGGGEEGLSFGGGEDLGEEDLGGGDFGSNASIESLEEPAVEEAPVEEPVGEEIALESARVRRSRLEEGRMREKKLVESYNIKKDDIYFQSLKECAVGGFVRHGHHISVYNQVPSQNTLFLETLARNNGSERAQKLREDSQAVSCVRLED